MLDGRPDQPTLGGLDVTVRRNAFGRQVDSVEQPVELAGVGDRCTACSSGRPGSSAPGRLWRCSARSGTRRRGRVVAVRQGCLLATAFHPELTGDARVHELFVEMVSKEMQ